MVDLRVRAGNNTELQSVSVLCKLYRSLRKPGKPDEDNDEAKPVVEEGPMREESLAQDGYVAGVTTTAKLDGEISRAAVAPHSHETMGNGLQSLTKMSVAEGIKKTVRSLKRNGRRRQELRCATEEATCVGSQSRRQQPARRHQLALLPVLWVSAQHRVGRRGPGNQDGCRVICY